MQPSVREVHIRREALRQFHPAWPAMQALAAAGPDARGAAVRVPAPDASAVAFPPTLEAPRIVTPVEAEGDGPFRPVRSAEDVAAALSARTQRALERELVPLRRAKEARLAAVQVALADEQRRELARIAREFERAGRVSAFREVSLRSQIDVLQGEAREQRVRDLEKLRQDDAAAAARRATAETSVRSRMAQRLVDTREMLEGEVERAAALSAARAAAENRRIVEEYRRGLRAAAGRVPDRAPDLRAPLPEIAAAQVEAPYVPASGRGSLTGWNAPDTVAAAREALIAAIDEDVAHAVRRIARVRGWRVAAAPATHITDETDTVARQLREAWPAWR